MADSMTFPATFDEFAEQYKIVDSKEVYTNGTELIPIFRVKQWLDDRHNADVVEIPKNGIGDLSDGYHTFNELYHHRAILFCVICNSMPDNAWKSKLHDTGDMFEGMFIVGIETPDGQATYHYDINPYWDMFKVKEIEKAPKWDGHTPTDAINRIANLSADVAEVVRRKDCKWWNPFKPEDYCKGNCDNDDNGLFEFTKPGDFCSYGERKDT